MNTTILETSEQRKARINGELLAEREINFNKDEGVRVGDFIKLQTEKGDFFTRITHDCGDSIQTGGHESSAYYLGKNYISYSGGLDSGLDKSDLIPTEETKEGSIWFFSENESRAHNGVYFKIRFRVFAVKEGANLKGLYDYHKELKKIAQAKLPTITRINGNGQPYITPLPEIHICVEMNDIFLKSIEDNTGMKFTSGAWAKIAQPITHEQLNAFFLTRNWKYKYYNNGTYENAIIITELN